ncbi:MAG: alpha/beta fold hydrolase [Acidobacteria bacterium]|nr:alpha/beta fold hydrolase [Acidobacteriota bacterium]
MDTVFHRSLFLDGPAGKLEALLWTQASSNPEMAALVCHPHPLFGGTMHNKVVYCAAKTLHGLGLPVLRFNFRGAGLSEGKHDEGRGEQDDVAAALDFLAAEFPGKPIVLGGFSFGTSVGLRVGCRDSRVVRVFGLGLAVNQWDMTWLRDCRKPKLFIQGSNDEYGSREKVEALFASLPEPKQLTFVEDADHFFAGKLDQVESTLRTWMQSAR